MNKTEFYSGVGRCKQQARIRLSEADKQKVREAASRSFARDSLIEIDPNAEVSMGENAYGDGDGCFVQAWVWVNFEDVRS